MNQVLCGKYPGLMNWKDFLNDIVYLRILCIFVPPIPK
jgi:hypothetical protein